MKLSRFKMKRARQLAMKLTTWGGKRPGSGREPKGRKALVSHARRPRFEKPTPAHVTLRAGAGVWNLRSRRSFTRIRDCFGKARGRLGLRIVEFSVQGNHLHLIVEADTSLALSRGLQGLCVRLARALNKMMDGRTGQVFADHYHSRLLPTPTEVVRAIAYVLGNHAHHFGESGVDRFCSSALSPDDRADLLPAPESWLLRRHKAAARTCP